LACPKSDQQGRALERGAVQHAADGALLTGLCQLNADSVAHFAEARVEFVGRLGDRGVGVVHGCCSVS
jgi:hypothetical protein